MKIKSSSSFIYYIYSAINAFRSVLFEKIPNTLGDPSRILFVFVREHPRSFPRAFARTQWPTASGPLRITIMKSLNAHRTIFIFHLL